MGKCMSYELFDETINCIKQFLVEQESVSDALEKHFCNNSFVCVTIGNDLLEQFIKVLCNAFGTPYEGKHVYDIISWWLYEDVEKTIYDQDGTTYDVSTTKGLYEYLTSIKD